MTATSNKLKSNKNWLLFNGQTDDFCYWQEKFEAAMQTAGLRKALLGKEKIPELAADG